MSVGVQALACFDRLVRGQPALVIDAARAPGFLTEGGAADTAPVCLFQGETAQTLADLAPYVADLSQEAPARALVRRYWGQGAFILVDALADVATLRRGLRKLSLAYGPDGEALFFRFYDPRVITAVAPSFHASHRAAFLNCVSAVFAETNHGDGLVRLGFSAGAVTEDRYVFEVSRVA